MKDYERLIEQGAEVLEEDKKKITLLVYPKFSMGWFIFWSVFTGVGSVFYLIYHYCKDWVEIKIKK